MLNKMLSFYWLQEISIIIFYISGVSPLSIQMYYTDHPAEDCEIKKNSLNEVRSCIKIIHRNNSISISEVPADTIHDRGLRILKFFQKDVNSKFNFAVSTFTETNIFRYNMFEITSLTISVLE